MFSGGIPPLALAVGLLALVCVASVAYVARGWPIAMRRALRDLTERVQAAEANYESATGKLAARLVELGDLTEELEGLAATIETKRRRVAASEARARSREGGEQPELGVDDREGTIAAMKQRARQMGWPI